MKKGELKKQEILRVAENRFCRYGFEATSVQDILDELRTSKGSFYHHFVSKEAVLEEICRNRAVNTSAETISSITEKTSPVDAVNTLFAGMIPFSGEKLSFLLMLLPVFSGTEGVQLKNAYAVELKKLYFPSIEKAIKTGTDNGLFACADPAFSAGIAVMIVNAYWMNVCDQILKNEKEGILTDPSDLLTITDQYRNVLERTLAAPFGSIDLIRLPVLKHMTEQLHYHMNHSV